MTEWPAAQKVEILRYRANNEVGLPPLQPVSTDLKIVSQDGVTILMPRNAATQSTFIRDLLDSTSDTSSDTPITVPIDSYPLRKVINFCINYTNAPQQIQLQATFLQENKQNLFQMLRTANFLEIDHLIDLIGTHIADEIQGKTSKEIRTRFNLNNDFDQQQQKEIDEYDKWCLT